MAQPVRLATPDDAADVTRLLIAFRDWMGTSSPPDDRFHANVAELLADPETEYLLAGDPALGVCQLRYRPSVWRDAPDCCLEDLYVLDEARGQGLGRTLVEAAFERARERGCRRMDLDVNEENAAAQALYESLGFDSREKLPSGRNLFMVRYL